MNETDPFAGLNLDQRRCLAAIGRLGDAGVPDQHITLPAIAEATGLPLERVQAAVLVLIKREREAMRHGA